MRLLGRREWAVLGGTLALLGGLGFVQSRGGWMEVMKMAPKVDSSTPAAQGGFELIGVERSTEEERSPRITIGETSVGGGIVGPIGSTRIWFRLPPATGNSFRIPRDDEVQTYVEFPSGARYPVSWEVGELSQRVVTLLVPGGYPPAEWMDIHVEGKLGKARWRLQRIPKTPYALPKTGSQTAEAEGMKVTATAVALARKGLGDSTSPQLSSTLRIDYTVDPPSPRRGNGTRLIWEKFIPEYQHPADLPKQTTVDMATPGERKLSRDLAFPFGDLLRHIAAKGRFEVWETVREPVTFENAKWTWGSYLGNEMAFYLRADQIQLRDGSYLGLDGVVQVKGGRLSKEPAIRGYYTPPQGKEREAHLDRTVVDLVPEASAKGWETKLQTLAKSGDQKKSVSIGSVTGYVEYYRVVRKVPFELLVPVRPAAPEEIAKEKAQLERAAVELSRDRRGAAPVNRAHHIEVKTPTPKK